MANFLIGEAVKFGWQTSKRHFWFFFRVLIVLFIVQMLFGWLTGSYEDKASPLAPLLSIISVAVHTIVNMGIIYSLIRIINDDNPRFSDIYRTVHPFWRYLGASVVYAILVGLGFVLLIVPGIILAIGLQFYSYLILDEDLGLFAALSRSWAITKGSRGKLILLSLVLGLINILGAVLFLVGLFLTIPLSLSAIAYTYKKLSDASATPLDTVPLAVEEPKLAVDGASAVG